MELKTINSKIKTLAKAETVTKALLAELSRDLLQYVVAEQSHDVDAINRTLAILTPMNKATAVLFFKAFVPHAFDDELKVFGKLNGKKKEQLLPIVTEKLENPDFNIWSWAADNVKVEQKPIDYLGNIKKAVTNALDESKGGLSQAEVIKAILEAGMDLGALVTIMQSAVNADAKPEGTGVPVQQMAIEDLQEIC